MIALSFKMKLEPYSLERCCIRVVNSNMEIFNKEFFLQF